MKLIVYILTGISVLFSSCGNATKNPMSETLIDKTDTCYADRMHTYELYLPPADNNCTEIPLLIIIDPQGNGKAAIEHFKLAANTHKIALASSNFIRNNDPDYMQKMVALISDVQSKYSVVNEVYIAGFSGGARMAISYAQYNKVNGLFICGALAPANELRAVKAPVMVVGGLTDFNFIEMAQYVFKPSAAPENVYIEFTNQDHSWPHKGDINSALGYIILGNTLDNICYKPTHIKAYCRAEKDRIISLRNSKDILQAGLMARNMSRKELFQEYHDFISIRNSIEYSQRFTAALDQLRESIRLELELRKEYGKELQQKDYLWWKKEIDALDERIYVSSNTYSIFALKRVKAFLGIACYSLCNQYSVSNSTQQSDRLLPIYEYLEPNNADMYYYKALNNYSKGNVDQCIIHLKKSKSLGFSNTRRMKDDFPVEILKKIL